MKSQAQVRIGWHRPGGGAGQRGMVLVAALILVMLLTMLVLASHSNSTSNVLASRNTQINSEAESAAKDALETVISTNFTTTTASQDVTVDMNNDGTNDYTVTVAAPVCVEAVSTGDADEDNLSSTSLPVVASIYNTVWDLRATVQDASTGASVTVHEGVMVQMSESDKNTRCP